MQTLKWTTNWACFHFSLIDTILVIWKELIMVWKLATYSVETIDKRLSQIFTLTPKKTRFVEPTLKKICTKLAYCCSFALTLTTLILKHWSPKIQKNEYACPIFGWKIDLIKWDKLVLVQCRVSGRKTTVKEESGMKLSRQRSQGSTGGAAGGGGGTKRKFLTPAFSSHRTSAL